MVDDGLHQERDVTGIELAVAVDMEQDIDVSGDRDADGLLKRRAEPARRVVPDDLGSSLSCPFTGRV
jgi:hypothetical protein